MHVYAVDIHLLKNIYHSLEPTAAWPSTSITVCCMVNNSTFTAYICNCLSSMLHSPVLRKRTMLNMERTVGTITPKKVLSFRGTALGVLASPVPSDAPMPHTALSADRPHTPWARRGVCSLDMAFSRSVLFLDGSDVPWTFCNPVKWSHYLYKFVATLTKGHIPENTVWLYVYNNKKIRFK